MAERTCETCRWWDKKEPHHEYANCRRWPPRQQLNVWVESRDRHQNPNVSITTRPDPCWPNTNEADWCGEHQPREVGDE